MHANHFFCIVLFSIIVELPEFTVVFTYTNVGKTTDISYELCILIFYVTFIWNFSHFVERKQRHYHKSAWIFV